MLEQKGQPKTHQLAPNPAKKYESPQEILESKTLSYQEKIRLLTDWEYDLRLEMVAAEENMTKSKVSGKTSSLLQEVHKCLTALGGENITSEGPGKI